MKNAVRKLVATVSPGLLKSIQDRRKAKHTARIRALTGVVAADLVAKQGWVVRGGPFDGMPYIRESKGSALVPKLMGIYERELFGVVGELIAEEYDAVVDVGCAEGYYAVGLAVKLRGARVYAYDIDVSAQRLCGELAALNGVGDRVVVRGACDHTELAGVLASHRRALVVCDCEGYEAVLLDPAKVAGLERADLLIELHEFAVAGVTRLLEDRLRGSHEMVRIPAVAANPDDYPQIAGHSYEAREFAVSEFRPKGMEWLIARAKGR